MSFSVMVGLERTLSNSSSLRTIGYCSTTNESAPAWLRICCLTDALRPWISDTTAMIDVTATMLPSTVINDRSFDDQMASSAMSAESRNLFMVGSSRSRTSGRSREFLHDPHDPPDYFFALLLSTLTASP